MAGAVMDAPGALGSVTFSTMAGNGKAAIEGMAPGHRHSQPGSRTPMRPIDNGEW